MRKTLVLVVVWLAWVALLLIDGKASGRTLSPSVTQGAGAAALIQKAAAVPTPPRPMLVVPPPETNAFYFAATATDDYNLESDYSNEVSVPQRAGTNVVTCAWDPSPGTNRIVNYKLYQGDYSRWYTNIVNCGTNLQGTVTIQPTPPRICVVTFSMTNGLSYTRTNPPANLFVGASYWRVTSTKWPVVMIGKPVLSPLVPWQTLAGPVTNATKPTATQLRVTVTKTYL